MKTKATDHKATDHKATDHKATDHFAWLPQGAKAKLGVRYAAHQTRTRSDIYNTVQQTGEQKENDNDKRKKRISRTY